MKFFVGITDSDWLEVIKTLQGVQVNFWNPGGRVKFQALQPGELFLFKKHKADGGRIVGGGYFVAFETMDIHNAWTRFGKGNGVDSLDTFQRRVAQYRSGMGAKAGGSFVGCIILENIFSFQNEGIASPADWSDAIVRGKLYDSSDNANGSALFTEVGRRISIMSMRNNGDIESQQQSKFKRWLTETGPLGTPMGESSAQNYVSAVAAVSMPGPKTSRTGQWNGIFEYLIGHAPSKRVYEITTLAEFDRIYGELNPFFESDEHDYGSYDHTRYDACFEHTHVSSSGDHQRMKNAYRAYRKFLRDSDVASSLQMGNENAREDVLAAIRTKPFILLAGISGTGKSRLVRQLARGCCPDGHELGKDKSGTANAAKKPGNFEMIPVRPNWHDSSELMGYVTRITDDYKPKYVIKPFVKFLVKAMLYKDVPFFLCLDEMNLAPVEQYFAEYLSVVETRKVVKDAAGNVTDVESDVLVDFDQPEIDLAKTVQELMAEWIDVTKDAEGNVVRVDAKPAFPTAKAVYDQIVADKGVRIPRNFIVMGTVNMDETTCSFSRKVLDRAMTFELNEVDMEAGLATDNSVPYGAIAHDAATATAVEGVDFYAANKTLCDKVKSYLEAINKKLDGTPFKFAYRSRNEIMLYCIERTKGGVIGLPQALDEATSMKILSRIEGDEDKLRVAKRDDEGKVVNDADGHVVTEWLLDVLGRVIPEALKHANDDQEPTPPCTVCSDKIGFMKTRLNAGFTSFFI